MFASHKQGKVRTLLLDDVFIGLDTANRIPLLELLTAKEISWLVPSETAGAPPETKTYTLFQEYQIFISTYDRHWYETAKRWFETHQKDRWKAMELYVNHAEHIPGQPAFDKPIGPLEPQSHLEKGIAFLCNVERPDFPSAANCFRKAYEEMIGKYVPEWLFRSSDHSVIADYRLTVRAGIAKNFLLSLGQPVVHLDTLNAFLPALLHPLSHSASSVTPYKGELMRVMNALMALQAQLTQIAATMQFRLLREKGAKLLLINEVSADHKSFYLIQLLQPLVLVEESGVKRLALAPCTYLECWSEILGKKERAANLKKRNVVFGSLEECYEQTYVFLTTLSGHDDLKGLVRLGDYVDGYRVLVDGVGTKTLREVI